MEDRIELTETRKKAIISLTSMMVGKGLSKEDILVKSFSKDVSAEERSFIEQVYDEMMIYVEQVQGRPNMQEIRNALYVRYGISQELINQDKARGEEARKDVEDKKEKWAEQDRKNEEEYQARMQGRETLGQIERQAFQERTIEEQESIRRDEQRSSSEPITQLENDDKMIDFSRLHRNRSTAQVGHGQSSELYRLDLFRPNDIATYEEEETLKEKPIIRLSKTKPENIVDNQYELDGITYIIRKTGTLDYLTVAQVQEDVSEYEIVLRKDQKEYVTRRFGNISINRMDEFEYKEAVLTQLLGKENLEDQSLHGYLGSLALVQEFAKVMSTYQIEYSPEGYTAVIALEQLEKEKGIRRKGMIKTKLELEQEERRRLGNGEYRRVGSINELLGEERETGRQYDDIVGEER